MQQPTFAEQTPPRRPPPAASAAPIQFPQKLQFLLREPKRFKVMYGGRGGAKSWGAARALIIIAAQRNVRVLCLRELQKSMEDSVHKLLCDQIEALGLGGIFKIEKKGIYCLSTGSSFSFEGIKNNASKVKSYEGIDYCWIEEAAKISKSSFNIVEPTIRKDGSEIWMTFNPELETDYIYDTFVKKPHSDAIVVKMSWRDNPWFPPVLFSSMEKAKAEDPDLYMNVWEGFPLKNLEGAIYAKELREAEASGRICLVPWEKEFPIDTFWDLGRGDNTAIWFCQRVGLQWRVLRYYEESGEDITHFLKYLQEQPYIYGSHFLPHDGKAKQLGSKKTIQEQLAEKYPKRVHIVPRQSVADGINATRTMIGRCWFDEELCVDGLNALRNYRFKVVDGQRSNLPLHNWASDGSDAFRTFAMARNVKRVSGAETSERLARAKAKFRASVGAAQRGLHGWMG